MNILLSQAVVVVVLSEVQVQVQAVIATQQEQKLREETQQPKQFYLYQEVSLSRLVQAAQAALEILQVLRVSERLVTTLF